MNEWVKHHTHTGILFSCGKEENLSIFNNMIGPGGPIIPSKISHRKITIVYLTYTQNIKKKQNPKPSSNRYREQTGNFQSQQVWDGQNG